MSDEQSQRVAKTRRSTTKQARQIQVTSLLAAKVPVGQIAETLGVDRRTISRDLADVGTALDRVGDLRRRFQALVEERMPIDYRAGRIRELADQNEQPMVALKALDMANHINNIAGASESGDTPRDVPLFALPAGSRVAIAIGPGVQESVQVAGRITDNKGT